MVNHARAPLLPTMHMNQTAAAAKKNLKCKSATKKTTLYKLMLPLKNRCFP